MVCPVQKRRGPFQSLGETSSYAWGKKKIRFIVTYVDGISSLTSALGFLLDYPNCCSECIGQLNVRFGLKAVTRLFYSDDCFIMVSSQCRYAENELARFSIHEFFN